MASASDNFGRALCDDNPEEEFMDLWLQDMLRKKLNYIMQVLALMT